MKTLIKHKGYFGSIEFDAKDIIFYGKLEFIKALVSYESKTAQGIVKAFREAVDDYLDTCAELKMAPEHPFKGSLNVRLGHELHKQVAIKASQHDVSVNSFICTALQEACAS
ncbi:MAG: toxin-antitoxin system HicB family antitoxin [Gammaproteobacteria bacterium CG11_big_fil_rev_8_21_14_0_20_46_22]|nr:MAG: toxin-antitoxin system HicB family antitoxin [Gammaproteobacteria bacterium CG12_big_fil_rev_8_21_14_0_65_46_12]PIR12073.1 MAG: toxin-antitoxin system HicB family antitoxin [Gammaproteobacteria bacterium CG11_big_fil_rev_8_21_14_0_20_46_22]